MGNTCLGETIFLSNIPLHIYPNMKDSILLRLSVFVGCMAFIACILLYNIYHHDFTRETRAAILAALFAILRPHQTFHLSCDFHRHLQDLFQQAYIQNMFQLDIVFL